MTNQSIDKRTDAPKQPIPNGQMPWVGLFVFFSAFFLLAYFGLRYLLFSY